MTPAANNIQWQQQLVENMMKCSSFVITASSSGRINGRQQTHPQLRVCQWSFVCTALTSCSSSLSAMVWSSVVIWQKIWNGRPGHQSMRWVSYFVPWCDHPLWYDGKYGTVDQNISRGDGWVFLLLCRVLFIRDTRRPLYGKMGIWNVSDLFSQKREGPRRSDILTPVRALPQSWDKKRTPSFWPCQSSLAPPMLVRWWQTRARWNRDTKESWLFGHLARVRGTYKNKSSVLGKQTIHCRCCKTDRTASRCSLLGDLLRNGHLELN